jgi:hypothetical protein
VWWLISPVYVSNAFNSILLSLLAFLFIPWTVLMYLLIYPGGIVGFWEWLLLILGIAADVASYAGGTWGNRNQIPGYET